MDPDKVKTIDMLLSTGEEPNLWVGVWDTVEATPNPIESWQWVFNHVFKKYDIGVLHVMEQLAILDKKYAHQLWRTLWEVKASIYNPWAERTKENKNPECDEDELEREKINWVLRLDHGTLEKEPWLVQALDMDPPYRSYRYVHFVVEPNGEFREVYGGDYGPELRLTVTIRDGSVAVIDDARYKHQHVQSGRGFDGKVFQYPFDVDEDAIINRAKEIAALEEWRYQPIPVALDIGVANPAVQDRYLKGVHGYWAHYDGAPDQDFDHPWDAKVCTIVSGGGGYQEGEPGYLVDLSDFTVWKQVASYTHSGETECPVSDWDPEERIDGERSVSQADTKCGEYPGERCRYCEEKIGSEHGYLSIGEGAETVFVQMTEFDDED